MKIRLFEEFSQPIPTQDYMEFVDMLKEYDVPIEEYGTGTYKTIGHLFAEIGEGETDLKEENGKLVRRVSFVGARVLYKKDGKWLRLYEDKQVFKDGRVRRRAHMPYSAAEKFKTGEDPKEVIVRGVKEELGLDITKDQFTFYNKKEVENNDDYPGITSYHTGHEFLVIINEDQYDPEGYIERQSDKDVIFIWKPLPSGKVKESFLFENLEYEEIEESPVVDENTDKNKKLIEDYIERNSFFGFFPYQNHKLKFWHVREIDGDVAKVVFQDINTQEDIELEFRVNDSKVRGYK